MIKIPQDPVTPSGCENLRAKAQASFANSLERLVDLLEHAVMEALDKKTRSGPGAR